MTARRITGRPVPTPRERQAREVFVRESTPAPGYARSFTWPQFRRALLALGVRT